ncbi:MULTISPECIES: hypothetical protein [unclassified Rathayibacter]|uniref:hypothetical protein n=1 Tax=unclassified Rathayibacter TaxID=2609250 RepID=UPI00188AAE55|nr:MULTISPECIES: hypothetical protein [unclassified Rathayibacter]MBF4460938.1 hypothetical protein [Rathayibacter sp. VKM Ac-2879]MBF4502349.1 hypothetical protein [Rathayibacter sp. VKM Ac-2878]
MARQTTLRIVIALSSTLLLAGCTSAADVPAGSGETSAASSATPDSAAPESAATGVAATPRPLPSVSTTPIPVSTECTVQTLGTGTLDGVDLEVVRDRGPRTGANGTVTNASDGTPASYRVVSGDSPEPIAERFCLSPDYLDALNSVRRDGVSLDSLFAGDTLNLRPSTVVSVGDQNGRVLDNTEPDDLPAQGR